SNNSNNSYDSLDYALYADPGTNKTLIVYESSERIYCTGVTYAKGDYMKVVRSGTSIKYYHIKAADGLLAKGTLLYTSSKTSNANTQLFLDSAFHSIGAKLSEMQILSGNKPTLSVDVYAPKPTTNAWHIDCEPANSKGIFTIGDTIKATLTLDKRVTLANVGRHKIV
ncbi:hypothetical protein, partial [Rhodococcus erythropolis]|uniref:hypothetical protein n=1 Tax=Rhodococcus erythropolis TaxID=1833 RepID=UPI00159F6D3A